MEFGEHLSSDKEYYDWILMSFFKLKINYYDRRLNCIFSEEAGKKSIIDQFLWSNGLGDWSANLKQGPS